MFWCTGCTCFWCKNAMGILGEIPKDAFFKRSRKALPDGDSVDQSPKKIPIFFEALVKH